MAGVTSIYESQRLLRLQAGIESAWGTPVAATSIIHGPTTVPQITPMVKVEQFDEQLGSLVESFGSAQLARGGAWSHGGNALYEDFLYVLCMAFGIPTPSSLGGGYYKWSFTPPVAGAFSPLSQTLELGNVGSNECIQAAGCLLESWTLKGEQSKAVTYEAKGFHKTDTLTTLTSSLAFRTVERVLMPQMNVALDVALATPGTTAFPGQLVTFEVSGTTGIKAVYAGGSKTPTGWTLEKRVTGLKLGLLWNETMQTYFAGTPYAGLPMIVQLKAASGTKALEVDYSGVLKTDPALWGNTQGAQLIELELGAQYDSALANDLTIALTNKWAALI
jgi:hypothetical protein